MVTPDQRKPVESLAPQPTSLVLNSLPKLLMAWPGSDETCEHVIKAGDEMVEMHHCREGQ